ncbi:MAG: peroxidase family protein [Isosphaeraceae bacterium]
MLTATSLLSDVRSFDGTGNNVTNPSWGSAGVDLIRIAPAAYADGVSLPAGAGLPSARAISNAVADQGSAEALSQRLLSAMIYAWGQFLDHDLDLTTSASPSQLFNIAVPSGDPSFDPSGTGTQVIPLSRSLSDPATGTSTANPRQQVNSITAWLDGSQIYGSDAATALALRTLSGGRLKTSAGADGVVGTQDDLLPLNNAASFPNGTLLMANDAHLVPSSQLFAAGDVRANENIELTSVQTLFVREHNRIADAIRHANPNLSDESVYQAARAQVIAELQVITYREWLPALLGPNALPAYHGYNPNVNPGIANEFSTALFRLGHSQLANDVEFLDNNGNELGDAVPLSSTFFNPALVAAHGVDPILKYLSSDPSSEVDTKVVDSVRNFLFGAPGAGGLDLASLNIQRGRDHGLADYNTMRAAYGLPRVTSFAQITSDPALQAKLKSLYGDVNHIDAWVGALAEDHTPGGSTGPLIRAGLVDQFTRLRDGDRFWYQNLFSGATLQAIENTTLASLIARNTLTTNLQANVFVFQVGVHGTLFRDTNGNGRQDPREASLAGRTVDLLDAQTGEVVATTTTDAQGRYRFGVIEGLRLGSYQLRVGLTNGETQTTPRTTIVYTRGETASRTVDLGVSTRKKVSPPRSPRPGRPAPGRAMHRHGGPGTLA